MGDILYKAKKFLSRLLKKWWFWAVVLLVLVVIIVVNSISDSDGTVLDLTQDFSQSQISDWETQNKQRENEYVLNGGYYLHFKGVNYPVVFTEGSITQFDNMPDDLFFYDIWELFTDSECKNRCAFRGRFTSVTLFKFNTSEQWTGYVLDEDRPKNGTILYFDETREKKFRIRINGWSKGDSELFGPDDLIRLSDNISDGNYYTIEIDNETTIPITDVNGEIIETFSTVRKLYTWAKNNRSLFLNKTEYTNIAIPNFIWSGENTYAYDRNAIGQESFEESELRKSIEQSYTTIYVETKVPSKIGRFMVNYQKDGLNTKFYTVLMDLSALEKLDYNISYYNEKYSNVIKNESGEIASYVYDGNTFEVFYGTMQEFSDFLLQDTYIDEITEKAISHFSLSVNDVNFIQSYSEDFVGFFESADVVKNLYAVWDQYNTVTLYGNEDNQVKIFKNNEYDLPTLKKAGYEFVGWYTTSDYQGLPIEKITYDDDYSELFAKFEKVDHYTLSFEPFSGQTFDDITYSYGNEVLLPVLSKAFHVFRGWCIDSELTSEPMKVVPEDFSGSYHLYPCFEPIEFSIKIIDSDKITEVKVEYGESFILSLPSVKDGFLGYFDAYGVQYTDETGKSLNPFTDGADIQLFAKYKTEE